MKTQEVDEKLNADQVTLRKGIFTARWGYFYRHGATTEMKVARVKAAFPEATIIDSGDHWAAFRGGAPLARQSHWWVKFSFPMEATNG